MPISFADTLGSGPGATYPAADATNQTVKGIGHFETLDAVFTEAANFQKIPGFIAVVLNPQVALYQYIGGDASGWANESFWTEVGAVAAINEYTIMDSITNTVSPFGKFDNTAPGPLRVSYDQIPLESQIVPMNDGISQIYDINTDGTLGYLGGNPFLGPLSNVNGPLSTFTGDTALSSLSFFGSVKVGYEFLNPGFAGMSIAQEVPIATLAWTGSAGDEVYDYLVSIPQEFRPYIYHLHMPINGSVQDELYLGYKSYDVTVDGTEWDDNVWGNPNNWVVLTVPNTSHVGLKVIDVPSGTSTFDLNVAYPVQNSKAWYNIPGASLTVGSLDTIVVILSFNTAMQTHLQLLKTDATDPSQFNGRDDIQVTLKTKISIPVA